MRRGIEISYLLRLSLMAALASCSNDSKPMSMHERMVSAAESGYTFGSERAAITVSDAIIPGPGGSLPTITIATATPNDTGAAPHGARFIARLHSSGDYAPLGIRTGDNYVWRDSVVTSGAIEWRILIVPKDTGAAMAWMARQNRMLIAAAKDPANPSRVAKSSMGYGACYECMISPGYDVDHCSGTEKSRDYVAADSLTIRLP